AKEVLHIPQRGLIQVTHGADYRVFIGEVVEGEVVDFQIRFAVGLVVNAQSPLFLHRVALVIEVGLVHRQVSHAIGFQEQRQVKLVLGQHFEVIGAVLGGGSVDAA